MRGVVASVMGYEYTGIDLRQEQVAANAVQAEWICSDVACKPNWICGDSVSVSDIAAGQYDFFFTCPPYGDLEVYSDDPRDLSAMTHDAFMIAYRQIIKASCSMLKPDSFAAIVIGDFRGKDGYYRNFVGETVSTFQAAGFRLYNEAILLTAIGSLPVRITKQFESGRKLGKTHQNILVFCNGDAKAATRKTKPTDFSDSLPGAIA